jgi:ABC-type nickel/cobalt efflux system permease component RcnA
MNSSALIMMLIANIIVTIFTAYYFWKVLRTPGVKHEGDFMPGP